MEVYCSKCKKQFSGATDFLDHFFVSHSLLRAPESEERNNHLQSDAHFSPIRSDCEICDQQIVERMDLGKHIEGHVGAMSFFCDLCHFPTMSAFMLRLHRRNHHRESSRLELMDLHECDMCSSFFKTLNELRIHYMVHLKMMPFSCGICKMMFQEKIDLVVHSHLHGETNHCFICAKVFSDRAKLLTHVLTHRKSQFFQKFSNRVEYGQLLTSSLQINSSSKEDLNKKRSLPPKITRVKSLRGSELKTSRLPGIRTDLKFRTSDAIESRSNLKSTTSDALKSLSTSGSRTPNATRMRSIHKSKTSDSIRSRNIFESRTKDVVGNRSIPKSRTSDAIRIHNIPKSRTSDAIRIHNIPKSRTSDAIRIHNILKSRTSGAIETQSILQSKITDVVKIWSLAASGVLGNKNNPRLETVTESENNLKLRNSVLFKKKNGQPRNSVAMDLSKLKTSIVSQVDPNLRTSDAVVSVNDCISNHKLTSSILVNEHENNLGLRNSVLIKQKNYYAKSSKKLKARSDSQDDPELGTSDIFESKSLRSIDDIEDGNDCISNYNFALAGCSTYRGAEPEFEVWDTTVMKEPDVEYQQDIDYLCDVVMEEKQLDLEHFISNISKDTRSNKMVFKKSMQQNGGPSNIYFCNTVDIEEDAESKKDNNAHTNDNQVKKFQAISQQDNFDSISPLSLVVTLPDSQSETWGSSGGFGSSIIRNIQPKSKSKSYFNKMDISIEEPEVQQNSLHSNSLEIDAVLNNRSKFPTSKEKKSKFQSSFNSNRNVVYTSKQRDSIPTTINYLDADISNNIIRSKPQFETEIRKTVPTCIQSKQSVQRPRPQFRRNNMCKMTPDRLISRKVRLKFKPRSRSPIRKANPVNSESQWVHKRSELQLRSNLNKSISNGLELQMPGLRSRSHLLNDSCEPPKSSELRKVNTRTRPRLRKDLFEATTKCANAQDLGFKKLSVLLHKLPDWVLCMKSYRMYCRMQNIEMLRGKKFGRFRQNVGEASLQEKIEACPGEAISCPSRILKSDSMKEKHFEIDNCEKRSSSSRSPNSMPSTSKQLCDADAKKNASIINDGNLADKIEVLKEKHSCSTKTPKTFSRQMYVSSPYKRNKKKSKFGGNRWRRTRRKTTKAAVKVGSLTQSQENSQKENDFNREQPPRKDSSIYCDNEALHSTLSNVGHFCDISTNENVSITRAVDGNSTCKTVSSKEEERSGRNSRKTNIFSKSHPKSNGNATPKMLSKNKQVKSIPDSIRSSPRSSSLSSKSCIENNELSGNTHTEKGFNSKLRSGLRSSKKTPQIDNQANICSIVEKQVLPCHTVSENGNGELIQYNTYAFQSTSYEQRSILHQTSEEFTPTLTILDASVQLERLPAGVCDMPSYKIFCNNKKTDHIKMLGMQNHVSQLKSSLNIPESVYYEPQSSTRSFFKQKCSISQDQNENSNYVCKTKKRKRAKKCVRKPAPKMGNAKVMEMRPINKSLAIKSHGESAIRFDKPKQIRNILYGKGIHCFHPRKKIGSCKVVYFPEDLKNCTRRKKVNDPVQNHTSRSKISGRKPNSDCCFSRSIELAVKLRRLPECVYEKHAKGKPITLSSLIPIVENRRSIHCTLKMMHQITIEHSYCCVSCLNSSHLIRCEHSYSSWSTIT